MHTIPPTPSAPTVRVIREYGFIVDDGYDGSVWEEDTTDVDDVPCYGIADAVEAITDAGCTENSGSWFSDPDGSYTVRYRDAYRCATTCHLYGFSDDDTDAIAEMVGKVLA